MKVILYMTTTVNGLIAKEDDSTDFVTSRQWASYVAHVLKTGAMIIGRRTYEVLSEQPEFQKFLKAKIKMVVVSREGFKRGSEDHLTAHSAKEALELLKNFKEVIVAGGGRLNASFLDENLIDEIFLDIEPTIVTKGIPLFNGGDSERQLKLLGSKMLSESEIQLQYAVLK